MSVCSFFAGKNVHELVENIIRFDITEFKRLHPHFYYIGL